MHAEYSSERQEHAEVQHRMFLHYAVIPRHLCYMLFPLRRIHLQVDAVAAIVVALSFDPCKSRRSSCRSIKKRSLINLRIYTMSLACAPGANTACSGANVCRCENRHQENHRAFRVATLSFMHLS
jgi:hypothetical protein